MGALTFTATLLPRGNACAIVLTDDQAATIGEGAKRFPVVVTVNGHSWRTSVARMNGESLIGFSREVRALTGVADGDVVTATVALDLEPRTVEVPEALAAALAADRAAAAAYERLAYTHRKEFARWIAEAKRAETRERRVIQAIEMLHEGRTRS